MYIELVRRVVEEAVEAYIRDTQQPLDEVLEQIAGHIEATSLEYRKDDPTIRYEDPLCRLGYLYMNAAVNATIFEKVLNNSDELKRVIDKARRGTLNVCSMGGGPGTELLGIAKYFLSSKDVTYPRKITFTVIDNILEWSDTWHHLADAVEEEFDSSLHQEGIETPVIAPTFIPLNVFDSSSYKRITYQCNKVDIVIFNYLFSENKTTLAEAHQALKRLAQITPDECTFVVIDRLEYNTQFNSEVLNLFESTFGVDIDTHKLGGVLDSDEQISEMGEMLTATLRRKPRVKFFTAQSYSPTVSWFVVMRKGGANDDHFGEL